MKKLSFIVGAALIASPVVLAKKTQSQRKVASTPEEELAGFTVPEGFVVELVASERDGVVNPIDISFDDAGRLWTQTAKMYPLDPVKDIKWGELLRLMDDPAAQDKNPEFKRIKDLYQGKTKGDDAILVLSNLYADAKPKAHTFADGLTIPQSILPYKNGVIVAQGSEMFFLSDSNNDGVADKRTPILTGFGFTDTHTMAHTLVRGPGGWVHFSQGALNKGEITAVASGEKARIDYSKIAKFSLDGKKLRVINSGLNNIWGFTQRGHGQWYGMEANDGGHSVTPMEEGSGFPGIGGEKLRPYQPWVPSLHKFRVGGTGLSGLAFSDDASAGFPAEWKDVAFLANPITSEVNAVKIVRHDDGRVESKLLPPLLKSKDDWFRPVHLEFGPEGALYVVDWYNKIVSHNELPTTHPDRDKAHGRIWRIRHKSQPAKPRVPNMYKVKTQDLVNHLKSPIIWEKRAAWHQIADRPISQTKPLAKPLLKLVDDASQPSSTRIHALWSLEAIGAFNEPSMRALLADKDFNIRREALRSLQSFQLELAVFIDLVSPAVEDSTPQVRAQLLRTIATREKANAALIELLVRSCRPELPGNAMGGSYERHFERYLARVALEGFASELAAFLNSPTAKKHDAEHISWASQSLKAKTQENLQFLLTSVKGRDIKESDFIAIAEMASEKSFANQLRPIFQQPENAANFVKWARAHQAQVFSDGLSALMKFPVLHALKSKVAEERSEALMATRELRVKEATPAAFRVYQNSENADERVAALQAMDANRTAHRDFYRNVFAKPDAVSFAELAEVVFSMSRLDGVSRNQNRDFLVGYVQQNSSRKLDVMQVLARSDHGLYQLRELIDRGVYKIDDVDFDTADKMHFALKQQKNATVAKVVAAAQQKRDARLAAAKAKLPQLVELAEKEGGNPQVGKVIFEGMCLSCHVVGTQGAGMGPALDGSSKREPEALLTAMLLPDEAAEGAYVLYRVIEKDGTIYEGLKKKVDGVGSTLGFHGGAKVFVPKSVIRKQEHVGSRSFMTTGLVDQLPDSVVADMLAYIRTMK